MQNLILQDLTLKGHDSNNESLVYVNYGTFIMQSGKISGNKTATRGGGVYVNNGNFTMNGGEISSNRVGSSNYNDGGGGVYVNGDFTMNGGEISGNTVDTNNRGACGGGGVYIAAGGTFTMKGGEISGNTAASGGGVYVDYYNSSYYSGTFRIVSGTIYGSNASYAYQRNTANSGAALYCVSDSPKEHPAQYGTFNGNTWNSNGDLGRAANNTIKVMEGVLQ
jgi:hypothetical protein